MPATPGVTVNATLLAVEAIQPVTAPVASVAPGAGIATFVTPSTGLVEPAASTKLRAGVATAPNCNPESSNDNKIKNACPLLTLLKFLVIGLSSPTYLIGCLSASFH